MTCHAYCIESKNVNKLAVLIQTAVGVWRPAVNFHKNSLNIFQLEIRECTKYFPIIRVIEV